MALKLIKSNSRMLVVCNEHKHIYRYIWVYSPYMGRQPEWQSTSNERGIEWNRMPAVYWMVLAEQWQTADKI